MSDEDAIVAKFQMLAGQLDERGMRLWAAAEADALGWGGTSVVARATGIARSTIRRGRTELERGETLAAGRVRRAGAGRKPLAETDPTLVSDRERLIDDDSRGDPEQPLRWTAKSLRALARELRARGHQGSASSVAPLLRQLGDSLQPNRKPKEGKQHPDRDAQFRHVNEQVSAAIDAGEPAISIDTKKQELVGEFKNGGRGWRPKGEPAEVLTHDFPSDARGKAIPFGVYDIASDTGFVSVAIDRETASFSVAAIRARWDELGRRRYPEATSFRSPPTAAAPTATACGCGRPSCRGWRMRPALRSRSATFRRGPASGARSSTAGSASSR